jgi:hypothetical protein
MGRVRSLVWLLPALACVPSHAQNPPQTPPDSTAEPTTDPRDVNLPMHTLHVYMDLIQIPVLVLDSERGRMKPIDPSKFVVSLDSGPTFRPKRVRQEGDDPITLGILIDPNSEPDLMPHFSDAVAALAPDSLHPKDHVTILAMDCGLRRSLDDAPASPEILKKGVDDVLDRWFANRKNKHAPPSCEKRVQLWDSMAFAIARLSQSPGRRVLLVVTTGVDGGSRNNWNDLLHYAQEKGVAVFGYTLSSARGGVYPGNGRISGRNSAGIMMSSGTIAEDPFDSICESSGGMIMSADPQYAAKQLVKFTQLVRERYILEFSRPRNDEAGNHTIVVTVPRVSPHAYIRSAGVTVLLPGAELTDNPDTIPRDTTDAPEMGKRKVLKPN